ncbi:uncharacterized protein LOC126184725 [Schistocerca cancellata]|uniref:uncharacterized protein LOC126184725 n=1 Tax=Schistocerca cancellata TaxID=274614 RepID=UPI0021191C94|nr:uncharacterized protein LOC126184725 [Schistocerca cancellata]
MNVPPSVSPAQVAGKRKSDDSHCRRIRPHSQDSGSDPPAGAGPATAAPSGAALAMDTEVVQPPVFSSAKCDWAADVEVDERTGSDCVCYLVYGGSSGGRVGDIIRALRGSPARNKWEYRMPHTDWRTVWRNIATPVLPAPVRATWYKVVNGTISTNAKLHSIHLSPSPACEECHDEDTIEHRFVCRQFRAVWDTARDMDCPKRSRPVQLPRTDGQDEVTWAAVALGASPARAHRVSDPEVAADAVAMDVTPSVPVADSSPALPVISVPAPVEAPLPAPTAVDRIEPPIVSEPAPAAVTLSVSEPVPEAAPSVVTENVSAVATVVVESEERLAAPAEPKPRRERPIERADNVPRFRSASISGVSSRKGRTPSPVVTCVPPYKSTSKQKKLQRASQRAAVDSRQVSAADRHRQRPAAHSQPEASVSSADFKRDETVRQLKVFLTQTDPVVTTDTAMNVPPSVSPAQVAGKRKSDDSHCRRIRPHSQDSGSDPPAGAGPATAAPSGAALAMDTEVVQPPVFSSAKCDWAADVEVDERTGSGT